MNPSESNCLWPGPILVWEGRRVAQSFLKRKTGTTKEAGVGEKRRKSLIMLPTERMSQLLKSDCQEGQLGDCQSLVEGGGVQVEGGGVQVEGGGQDQTIASNPSRVGVSEKTFQDQDAGSQQRVGSMRVRQIRDVRQENRFSICVRVSPRHIITSICFSQSPFVLSRSQLSPWTKSGSQGGGCEEGVVNQRGGGRRRRGQRHLRLRPCLPLPIPHPPLPSFLTLYLP